MRILITGVNGFLGSNIAKYFLKTHHNILGISLHINKIQDIINNITFYECDMQKILFLKHEILAFDPDVVIHCAWDGGNNFNSTQNTTQFHRNLPGIANLMEILKEIPKVHFIGIGSGSEYGDSDGILLETTKELPISLYGTCKLMSRLYTEQFCKIHGLKWTWIRPMYTYGPNDVSTRLIPKTIVSCLNKEIIKLDQCKAITDYLFVEDFASAIQAIILNKCQGIFNICSSNSYSVRAIVEKIALLTDNIDNIHFGVQPERNGYPSKIVGSNKKLRIFTNWTPLVDIDEGITKTIEFYKNI